MCTFFVFALERLRAIIGSDYPVFAFCVTFFTVCIGELALSPWSWPSKDRSRYLVSMNKGLGSCFDYLSSLRLSEFPSAYFSILILCTISAHHSILIHDWDQDSAQPLQAGGAGQINETFGQFFTFLIPCTKLSLAGLRERENG